MLAVWRVHGFDAILREAWQARSRARRLERRDDLLVRGRRHRLVRPAARGDARRARLPAGQRLPALRRRGAAAARLPRARRATASRRARARRRRAARATTARSWREVVATAAGARAATASEPGRRASRSRRALAALAPAARAELREPGDGAQADPDRRQHDVEDDVGDDEDRRTRAPSSAAGSRGFSSHERAPFACRSSTTRSRRWAVSSIESSEMSITGQPSRRCSFVACSSSS